jgi:hypothetical protein
MALEDNFFGLVPVAIFHSTLEVGSMVTIQIGEDAVLILQASIDSLWGILYGSKATTLLGLLLDGGCAEAYGCRSGREDAVGEGAQDLRVGGMPREHLVGTVSIERSRVS